MSEPLGLGNCGYYGCWWVGSYRKILETIAAEKVGDGKLGDKVIKFDILGMADEVPMTTMDGALRATGP